jgi:phage-related protein
MVNSPYDNVKCLGMATKKPTTPSEKPIIWLGSTLKDLRAMSENVQDAIGFDLGRVQQGQFHSSIKPLKGLPGVQEIRADVDSDTYRAVYVMNLGDFIYMLHVFKKKSKQGSETPEPDMDVINARLKQAKELANEQAKKKQNSRLHCRK